MICKKCNSEIADTSAFCPNCGQKVSEENKQDSDKPGVAQATAGTLSFIAALVTVIIGLIAFVSTCS
jgi:uncharacterized membrane protein YvbJ